MLQYIVPATGLLFTLENILWINIGVFVGSVFAAIPGLSVILCVILFLPVTYTMTAIPGMMFLLGIYCAGGYGGSYDPAIQRIRLAIRQGNLNLAEELLNARSDHNAEWNFLKGAICFKRGWLDEAKRYYETAVQMDPGNPEYQQALAMAEGRSAGYRPAGYSRVTTGGCD